MTQRADELIDRRRLRRKLTFWRASAFILVALAIVAVSLWAAGDSVGRSADHVAQIKIEGTITADDELLARLKDVGDADAVKGVILAINSPGGTTAGGEAIFEAVRELSARKPVVAQVGTLAASAGYMIASATDHIVARQSSIVGSIGVIVQFPNVTGLLDKLGVEVETIRSSPLKAEPSPFNETTEEERAMIYAMVRDSYDWFVDLVADRRSLSRVEVLKLADGSVFTGRQAVDRKLVDTLGGEAEALAWLEGEGVGEGLEVIEWKPRREGAAYWISGALVRDLAGALGLPVGGETVLRHLGIERIFLDGLLSVWQPEQSAGRE